MLNKPKNKESKRIYQVYLFIDKTTVNKLQYKKVRVFRRTLLSYYRPELLTIRVPNLLQEKHFQKCLYCLEEKLYRCVDVLE